MFFECVSCPVFPCLYLVIGPEEAYFRHMLLNKYFWILFNYAKSEVTSYSKNYRNKITENLWQRLICLVRHPEFLSFLNNLQQWGSAQDSLSKFHERLNREMNGKILRPRDHECEFQTTHRYPLSDVKKGKGRYNHMLRLENPPNFDPERTGSVSFQ